jgi:hypothetical protein
MLPVSYTGYFSATARPFSSSKLAKCSGRGFSQTETFCLFSCSLPWGFKLNHRGDYVAVATPISNRDGAAARIGAYPPGGSIRLWGSFQSFNWTLKKERLKK